MTFFAGSRLAPDKLTYSMFGFVFVVWVLVWVLKVLVLDVFFPTLTATDGNFYFWTAVKLVVWIFPAWALIRLTGRTVPEVFNVRGWRLWLKWGLGMGLVIALTAIVTKFYRGGTIWAANLDFSALSVLTVAPLLEEFFLRGAIMVALEQRISALRANIMTSLLFVLLHIPGWYFSGDYNAAIWDMFATASSIILLGFLFGLAAQRGKSVIAAMIAHFFNNLFAT